MIALINEERIARGLPAVVRSNLLDYQSQQHSFEMAKEGRLYHSDPGKWGGECVGVGSPNWAAQVDAWMASPPHRAIILDPDYIHAGAGGSGAYRTIQFS